MIDQASAIEIARARAAQNGWAFGGQLQVLHRRGWFGQHDRFEIETNAGMLGTKARLLWMQRLGRSSLRDTSRDRRAHMTRAFRDAQFNQRLPKSNPETDRQGKVTLTSRTLQRRQATEPGASGEP
jgi:hypothetical protein